jgi:serine/threonine protein kinase
MTLVNIGRLKMFQNIRQSPLRLPTHLSEEAKDLIKKLMDRTPTMRLGMGKQGTEEVKVHLWFKSIDWEAALNKELPVKKLEVEPIVDNKINTEVLGKNEDDTKYIEGWDFQKEVNYL